MVITELLSWLLSCVVPELRGVLQHPEAPPPLDTPLLLTFPLLSGVLFSFLNQISDVLQSHKVFLVIA
jgi:hypothetical protein